MPLLKGCSDKCHIRRLCPHNPYTGDKGEDGRCWIEGKLYLIQVKRYTGYVDTGDVVDFVALCRRKKAGGLFVTSGRVGPTARRKAEGQVHVINGQRLIDMLCA